MARTKTVLIIDDVEDNVAALMALLEDQYDLIASLTGDEAIAIAEEEKIDLILLDILMPDMDGFLVCKMLKSNEKTRDIPVIFITVKTDEDSIEQAYEMGGVDYITKPFKSREVLSRIKKELKLQDMVHELAFLASTDPLTNLYNRRYFAKITRHILALAKREKETLSLIMLDIDNFKQINDTYGHQTGDSVLVNLADTIMVHLRKSDFACRFGGEEFVVLLPNTPIDDARLAAEKLRKAIEENAVKSADGQTIHYTVSLGVSLVEIEKESNAEPALKRADDALYLAKKAGKNRVQ